MEIKGTMDKKIEKKRGIHEKQGFPGFDVRPELFLGFPCEQQDEGEQDEVERIAGQRNETPQKQWNA